MGVSLILKKYSWPLISNLSVVICPVPVRESLIWDRYFSDNAGKSPDFPIEDSYKDIC